MNNITEEKANNYLICRQNESVDLKTVDECDAWRSMDVHSVSEHIKKEFIKLRDELDKGHPTPLIIVKTDKEIGDHMVLAVESVQHRSHSEDTTIYVYDPNNAQDARALNFKLGGG